MHKDMIIFIFKSHGAMWFDYLFVEVYMLKQSNESFSAIDT